MNRVLKSAILSVAVAATTLSALPAANAGDRWRHGHHGRGSGDLVAAGVLGLAVGAIAAGIATSNDRDYYEPAYRNPPPRPRPHRNYYVQPEVVYLEEPGLEPWSVAWFRFCDNRYQSFDAETGTFIGYDGRAHFCQAN